MILINIYHQIITITFTTTSTSTESESIAAKDEREKVKLAGKKTQLAEQEKKLKDMKDRKLETAKLEPILKYYAASKSEGEAATNLTTAKLWLIYYNCVFVIFVLLKLM